MDSKILQTKKLDSSDITIGRDSINDICINNLAVSRFHAKIYEEGDKIFIEDMNSSNGTYVNGEKVDISEISEFDNILVGKYNLTIENKSYSNNQNFAYVEDSTVMVDDSTREKILNKVGYSSKEIPLNQNNNSLSPKLIISDVVEVSIEKDLFTIGKSIESDVYLDGFLVKKSHATIVRGSDKKSILIDNGSILNTTKVNGRKIKQKVLVSGDVIEIGKHKMIYLS